MTTNREGWVCPTCKRGVSPDEKHCDHQGGNMIIGTPVYFPYMPDPVTAPIYPLGPFPTTPDPTYYPTTTPYPYQTNPYPYVTTCDMSVDSLGTYPMNNAKLQ